MKNSDENSVPKDLSDEDIRTDRSPNRMFPRRDIKSYQRKKIREEENDTHNNTESYPKKRNMYENNFSCSNYIGVFIAIGLICIIIVTTIIIVVHHQNTMLGIEEGDDRVTRKKFSKFLKPYDVPRFFTEREISLLDLKNLTEQDYVDLCRQGILLHKKPFVASEKPAITVVRPVYNGYKYMTYSLRSIQNQNFTNIEILFIDDFSNDKGRTVDFIKKYQEKDPRIRLIQNDKNYGILYTLCLGILNSKGKYIMELDQDDLFITNTLFSELYNEAEKYNYDVIKFKGIEGQAFKMRHFKKIYRTGDALYPPTLTKLSFRKFDYKSKYFEDGMIWNKFVKTEVYQKAVNTLGKQNYQKFIYTHADYILIFMLLRTARSLKEYGKFGHFRYKHDESISSLKSSFANEKSIEQLCYDFLVYCDVVFDFSENTTEDKNDVADDVVERLGGIKNKMKGENKKYALQILEKYLNCEYINYRKKHIIKEALYDYIKDL